MRTRRFAVILLAWGLLVCYTRMYMGVHYPSDLLLGGIIGTLFGVGFAKLAIYYAPRWERYRKGQGYKTYSVNVRVANGDFTLSLAPLLIPVAVLLLTLIYGGIAAM